MFSEENNNQNNILHLIKNFQICRDNLISFLSTISNDLDQIESDQLQELDLKISEAFENLVHFRRENLTDSIQKIEFLVKEFTTDNCSDTIRERALRSVVEDLKVSFAKARQQNFIEKRSMPRKQLNIFGATVRANYYTSNCIIKNVTKNGICLIVEHADGLPDKLELTARKGAQTLEMVKVWRNNNEIGGIITQGNLDLSFHHQF